MSINKKLIGGIVILVSMYLWGCNADNHVQVTDITVNEITDRMTDHYLCINCLVDEDSTWAETTHWHNDTTCLYSMGMFVGSTDTIKCDTVRVKKLSKKLSELHHKISSHIIEHVDYRDIKRVISLVN